MKIKKLIKELQKYQEIYGEELEVEVQNQDDGGDYYGSSEIHIRYDKDENLLIL